MNLHNLILEPQNLAHRFQLLILSSLEHEIQEFENIYERLCFVAQALPQNELANSRPCSLSARHTKIGINK